jgi:hypothetical protein
MKRKEKSKKTVIGHMQNRSVVDYLFPGGSLLPILIKFIPKLLPSAFNENLDIDKKIALRRFLFINLIGKLHLILYLN